MITLITATIGSGKTLKCIELCFEYLNKGYVVYSNIIGLKISGVLTIPSDADWRDLDSYRKDPAMADKPCCVIYDEAHEHPAFSEKDLLKDYQLDRYDFDLEIENINLDESLTDREKKKKVDDVERKYKIAVDTAKRKILDIGDSLSMSRHFGFDIFLVTQRAAAIRPHILGLIGQHWHMRRLFGLERSWVYVFPEAQTRADSKSVRNDAIHRYMFSFPKHLYKFYISTEINTHKRNIPKKLVLILSVISLIPIIGLYRMTHSDWFHFGKHEEEVKSSNVNPAFQKPTEKLPEPDTSKGKGKSLSDEEREESRIAMIIESDSDCYAKNAYGDAIDIPLSKCRMLSKKNKLLSFSRLDKSSMNSFSVPAPSMDTQDEVQPNL